MPGNYSKVATVVTGQTITAAERNTEHDNHITYQTPAGTDDYSTTVTEMRTVSDPYPAGTPSQPTSLAGEIERIRYLIAQITGNTYWYEDPESALTGYRLESADHTHQTTGMQAGTLDHGLALTGLTDDDHTQYALLAGRATGQSIIGGTAASETLTLKSTSNATKGKVIFGNAGTTAYDEVNERVGIGTASPGTILEVSKAGSLEIRATNTSTSSYAAIGEDATGAYIEASNSKPFLFYTGATERWRINASGHLLAGADNTYDIGAAGATRPRDIYASDAIVLGRTGVSGTVLGFAEAGANLTLRSTTHATKGKVVFGASGTTVYDEVNERFGINTAAPAAKLHIVGGHAVVDQSFGFQAFGVGTKGDANTEYTELSHQGAAGAYLYVLQSGTGVARDLNFYLNGAVRWTMKTSGHILAGADNSYDIGASGATRPRDVYIAGELKEGSLKIRRSLTSDPQELAQDATAWTTTATVYNTFTSVTLAVGDIIEIHYFASVTGAASTTAGQVYVSQPSGTATVEAYSSGGTFTLTSAADSRGVWAVPVTSAQTYTISSVVRLICTVAGTAVIGLAGRANGATATSSTLISSMIVWKNG